MAERRAHDKHGIEPAAVGCNPLEPAL
jgi:hypothetical protein